MGPKLRKELGLLDVFCIASGAMISSGLFILPGIASARIGPSLFISYIIASFLALPALLSKAELATAMPKAGGDYFFITRTMGLSVGTIGGFASWFSLSLKSAFALVGMGAYVALIVHVPISVVAILLCILFVAINIKGAKEAGIFQRYLVAGLFVALIFYIIKGFAVVDVNRFAPFVPYGKMSVFTTAGFVFISYGGLTKIASLAEEVKNPGRNIPLGMILSIIIVSIFYALVIFVTTGILDPEKLYHSLTPIADGAQMSMGVFGNVIMVIAALLAFISTANAGIMAASRYPIAMARDKIIPSFFKKINERYKTPHVSIMITGVFMIIAILFLKLELLVKAASTFLILLYIFINIAVIIMRESKIQNYRPTFRAPLYPWIQIAGILSGCFLIFEMGESTYIITISLAVAAFAWYFIYVKPNVIKEYALVHVIERIAAKELTTSSLEKELKDILRERDDIIEDRFDKLISRSTILDIDEPLSMEEFFKRIAASSEKELGVSIDKIYELLIKREKESSTVIRAGLAIPHIVVEGKSNFRIVLARCKGGVKFPESKFPVNIVFVLAGTKDERNFHLRALAAIAEIAQNVTFDEMWLNARNTEELKDIILLAERKRAHSK